MTEERTGHTLDWIEGDRRSGSERRVAVMERADERRQGERRITSEWTLGGDSLAGAGERTGTGRQPGRPDPIAALFEGADGHRPSQFIPPMPEEKHGLAALRERLAPRHDAHDAIPSLAAIAGHPLHPMLVPLPIGAFVGALAADIALAATGDRFFGRAGRLLTGAGLATGVVTSALGGVDFWGRSQVRSHPAAWLHVGGNAAALALGAASLAVRARAGNDGKAALPVALALSASAGALLVVTGWLGGELAYRHRIGVMKPDGGA